MKLFTVLTLAQVAAASQGGEPVLEFPEAGLDDSAAYEGYRTRFYRDAASNAFQIYLDEKSGRVVHVWANAANESAGFTARDAAGRPARLEWAGADARVSATGDARTVEYELEAPSPVRLGFFLLGSMRVERDFQYREAHLRPFESPPFRQEELVRLIHALERLDDATRREHMALLHADDTDALRARLEPTLSLARSDSAWSLRVEQPYFDGRNRMILEVAADERRATVALDGATAVFRSDAGGPVRLRVRVTTDAAALGPLKREDIFNTEFLEYLAAERAAYEQALEVPERARGEAERTRILGFRRMERQVRAAELLSYREKLMAGMPNYATYFGRDMLMTALMMEPVWTDAMQEHVIASVLRKLSPDGEVSHEEALGGQAIRENAAAYAALLEEHGVGDAPDDTLLERAGSILRNLRVVRENYHMVDDDYQFPVLAAHYLGNAAIPMERRRAFLLTPAGSVSGPTRLALLLRNLVFVARTTAPYAADPTPSHLIGFERLGEGRWRSGSWRDSGPGYANGRFAMDVNAIWVPEALESIDTILTALRALGFGPEELERAAPEIHGSRLAVYARDAGALRNAARTWRGAERHFVVTLVAEEAAKRVAAKVDWLPEAERRVWERVLRTDPLEGEALSFLALALDTEGRPIPVASTDPALRLFLDNVADPARDGPEDRERVSRILRVILLPYPVGLFIEGAGVVATNDAYADRAAWDAFARDPYHSPVTIWGREVNLLLLGLARQLEANLRPDGTLEDASLEPVVHDLDSALRRVLAAVDASGLSHNELWSYRVVDDAVAPVRYATSTDIQLWNVTGLAVRYRLGRLRTLGAAHSGPGRPGGAGT